MITYIYMKPHNASKNMCLWAQTANQKVKQNAQTQHTVLYMTQLKAISHNNNIDRGRGGSKLPAPTCPLMLWPRDEHHFKTKNVWHLPPFEDCEVFSNNFILYLLYLMNVGCNIKLADECLFC